VAWVLWKWLTQDDASEALEAFLTPADDEEQVPEYYLGNTLPPQPPVPMLLEDSSQGSLEYDSGASNGSDGEETGLVLYDPLAVVVPPGLQMPVNTPPPTAPPTQGMVNPVDRFGNVEVRPDLDPIVAKNHRRVKKKDPYAKSILAKVRTRFGVPERTAVNKLAVRRFALAEMDAHRVRYVDRAKLLPFIVAAAFIPTDEDIAAEQWLRCAAGKQRMAEYRGEGSKWCGLTSFLGGNLQTRQ